MSNDGPADWSGRTVRSDEAHGVDSAADTRPGPAPAGTRPDRLGRFPVTGVLGRGGMGEVLEVSDTQLGRVLAAKVMLGRQDADAVARFVQEAQVNGQLEHPHIIPIHELGQTEDGRTYFTMKRVDGEDLAGRLDRLRDDPEALTLVERLQLFLKVCDAIGFAHSRGVVHRDLKPANIMLGSHGEVQVMDWGLVKVLGQDAGARPQSVSVDIAALTGGEDAAPSATLDGAIKGTPTYMAPEQVRGDVDAIDARTDVYALGALLYELLTLEPPYVGGSVFELFEQVSSGALVPPTRRAPARQVPWELEAVVLKAMAIEPDARYQGVPALRADIARYLEGRPLGAASYDLFGLLRKWAGRNRALVAGMLVALAVGVAVAVWFERRGRAQERQRIEDALADARAAIAGCEDARALRARARARTTAIEPDDERAARERSLEGYLAAVSALDRARALAPGSRRVRAMQLRVGRQLGAIALLGGDYTLARRAFSSLPDYGGDPARSAQLVRTVDEARTERRRHRRARLAALIAELGEDLERDGRPAAAPTMDDIVFEALGYQHAETLEILWRALEPLVARASARGRTMQWSTPDRQLVRFGCRVLARLDVPGRVDRLGRILAVLRDVDLVTEAGLALCTTRDPAAWPHLKAARSRLGAASASWRIIQRSLRLVRPPAEQTGEALTDGQLLDRASLAAERGDLEAAFRDFATLIARDPAAFKPWLYRGHAHLAARRYREAIGDYDRAEQRAPSRPEIPFARGQARALLGDHAAAIEDFDRSLQLDPRSQRTLLYRSNSYTSLGRYRDSERDLDALLAIKPTHRLALSNRASLRMRRGDLTGAVADLDIAIAQLVAPRAPDSLLYYNRANIHRAAGKLQRAVADYDRALALDPRLEPAYCNRGVTRLQLDQEQGALEDFARALQLEPKNFSVLVTRGAFYRRNDQLELARKDLASAVQIEPRRYEAWGELALTLEQLGRREEARDAWRSLLNVPAPRAMHATARQRLERR